MQKFAAWMRRHKTVFLVCGMILGIALLMWTYVDAPININRMQSGDWKDLKLDGIGTETIQKLESNGPYKSMNDIDNLRGIGSAKMEQIQHHFTTWDTMRSEVWYIGFFGGLILTFGCGLSLWANHRRKHEHALLLSQMLESKVKNNVVKK